MDDDEFDDYYSLLKIAPTAGNPEIDAAYKQAMRYWHPDMYATRPAEFRREAESAVMALNQAYEVLSDPVRRAQYDEIYADWKQYVADELAAESSPLRGEQSELIAFLNAKNLRHVDNRNKGGVLWVVGGDELAPLIRELQDRGYTFKFAKRGSRAAGRRAAWFLL